MLMEPKSRVERWKIYFERLLNGMMPAQLVFRTEYERAEPPVYDVSLEQRFPTWAVLPPCRNF